VLARASIGDELNALTRQIDAAKGGPIECRRIGSIKCTSISNRVTARAGDRGCQAGRLDAACELYEVCGHLGQTEAPTPLNETLELQAGTKGRWFVAHVRSGRPLAVIPPATTSAALLAAAARVCRHSLHRRRAEGRGELHAGGLPLRDHL
jgi:hypothetical protein